MFRKKSMDSRAQTAGAGRKICALRARPDREKDGREEAYAAVSRGAGRRMGKGRPTCGRLLLLLTLLAAALLLVSCGGGKDAPSDSPEEKDDAVTVRYLVDPPCAATVTGKSVQRLKKGERAGEVGLKETGRFVFEGWSDGVKTQTRSGDAPTEDITYTARYAYQRSGLPTLFLELTRDADAIERERYLSGKLTVTNGGKEKYNLSSAAVEVRGRGNSTWDMTDKKSYKLKLGRKEQLLGIGKSGARNWVLQACAWDKSFLRNWSMWRLGELFSGIPYSSAGKFVELYINGDYMGVYCLCEPVEVHRGRVDIDDSEKSDPAEKGYLLELDFRTANEAKHESCIFSIGEDCYEVKSQVDGKQDASYIENYMRDVYRAAKAGDEKTVAALIDLPSFVDMYILEELSCDRDVGKASLFFYKAPGGKLFLTSPWDFDLALGNDVEYEDYDEKLMAAEFNALFAALTKTAWFKAAVKARYAEVRPLIAQMTEEVAEMGKFLAPKVEANYEYWGTLGIRMSHEPTKVGMLESYEEQVEYLCDWLKAREQFLNKTFSAYGA